MKNPPFKGIVYDEGEEVLYHCRCGKGAHVFFVIIMLLFVPFFFLPPVVMKIVAVIQERAGAELPQTNWGAMITTWVIVGIVEIIIGVLWFVTLNHDYLITNRRVIFGSGKNMKAGRRILHLKYLAGVNVNQSIILTLFRLSSIDFFSSAATPRTKTFLLFSFVSTPLKFGLISKKDADAMFPLIEKLLAEIANEPQKRKAKN